MISLQLIDTIVVTFLGSILLILCILNIHFFLIKQEKYKHVLNVLFYVVAILTIAATIFSVWIGGDYYCNKYENFVHIAIPYLTLVMGLC